MDNLNSTTIPPISALQMIARQATQQMQATKLAAYLRGNGSYAQRNPTLGKMIRCPYCRTRRRQFTNFKCCSFKYSRVSTDEHSIPPVKGHKNQKLTRKNPPLFLMKQILLDLEVHPEKIVTLQSKMESRLGLKPLAGKEVRPEHLAIFVEKYVLWEKKIAARAQRARQRHSRKINWGVRAAGSRP